MRHATIPAFVVFGLAGMALIRNGPDKPADPPSPPLGPVSVRLLGPASEIRGTVIPPNVVSGKGTHFVALNGPRSVTLTLPDGKVVTSPIKFATINTQFDLRTKSAVVTDVALLPLPKAVPLGDAVAEIRRGLVSMGITPDDRMRHDLAAWQEVAGHLSGGGEPSGSRTGMDIDELHGLSVEVRPNEENKWFLVYTFEVMADARRPMWDPNYRASGNPPEVKQNEEISQGPAGK